MWVVKLGGSLQDSACLKDWLQVFAAHGGGKMVLVPGGGKYADKVRQEQILTGFSDGRAHALAIGAMEQFARDLCRFEPRLKPFSRREQLPEILRTGGIPVWLPSAMVVGRPAIPETWDVTSDSLALWLAGEIRARALVLIKSAAMPAAVGSIDALSGSGLLDAFFPSLFRHHPVKLEWFTAGEWAKMKTALISGTLPGSARLAEPPREGAVLG